MCTELSRGRAGIGCRAEIQLAKCAVIVIHTAHTPVPHRVTNRRIAGTIIIRGTISAIGLILAKAFGRIGRR